MVPMRSGYSSPTHDIHRPNETGKGSTLSVDLVRIICPTMEAISQQIVQVRYITTSGSLLIQESVIQHDSSIIQTITGCPPPRTLQFQTPVEVKATVARESQSLQMACVYG